MCLKISLILFLLNFLLFSSSFCASVNEFKIAINNKEELKSPLKAPKIVVIPTSSHLKSFIEARDILYKELKEKGLPLPEIKVLSFLKDENLIKKELSSCDVLLLNLMSRSAFEATKAYLSEIKKRGGFIFGLYSQGSYDEEMKNLGIEVDHQIEHFNSEGGQENLYGLYVYVLKRFFHYPLNVPEVKRFPYFGIYDCKEKKIYSEEELKNYFERLGEKAKEEFFIGLTFYRTQLVNSQREVICAIEKAFEKEGIKVISAFGYPDYLVLERIFLKSPVKIRTILALSLKVGLRPEEVVSLLEKLKVPVFNLVIPFEKDFESYLRDVTGLGLLERSWQVFVPELIGAIGPIIVGFKKKIELPDTKETVDLDEPYFPGIEGLVKKVKGYLKLQQKSAFEKKVVIIYYNYPPGKQNIGAAYLNVPESLWLILKKLEEEGYDLGEEFKGLSKEEFKNLLLTYGRNIAIWAPEEIKRLAHSGRVVLLPLETYESWFYELPKDFRERVIKDWGNPKEAKIMTYKNSSGRRFFILPLLKFGKILLGPQPSRAWEQDIQKAYHSSLLSPHHQYVAFYLYLKKFFQADALIHLGTHGTLEWLPGREVGLLEEDDPKILLGDLPNIYPYIVDDVGEGLQAKRRTEAVIIDHLVPPLKRSTLNPDLRKLKALIQDYFDLKEKATSLALTAKKEEIVELLKKLNLHKELEIDLKSLENENGFSDELFEKLEDYFIEIENSINPFGLHSFGKPYEEDLLKEAAKLLEEIHHRSAQRFEKLFRISAQRELENLLKALKGEYVLPGPGNDPIRNPQSLPTGKNFFAFDPSRIPSPKTYEIGKKLAQELLEKFKEKMGRLPEKVAFVLWAVETIRHQGIMESQIMYLLGVKPRWDERGRVIGLELIPSKELQRPRLDVVITISGLYRDLFSSLVKLLDEAVSLALSSKEDSPLKRNKENLKRELQRLGLKEELSERLSRVRIFSEERGGYGIGLDKVISASHTWKNEKEVAQVYIKRLSFLYGQGFWGEDLREISNSSQIREYIFSKNLSKIEIALHSRATQVFATLDNDDYFQYLGGLALAIKALDGKSPSIFITNLSDPRKPAQETLARVMGREIKTRYLNPEWIKAMLKEGYSGARFIDKVVEHLFGFQVTSPEIITYEIWEALYEVYVKDKYGLHIKKTFERSNNLYAYQSIIGRLLEVIRKGYWKPDAQIIETLTREYMETYAKVGLACCEHTCNNPLLSRFITQTFLSLPTKSGVTFSESSLQINKKFNKDNQNSENQKYQVLSKVYLVKGLLLEESPLFPEKNGKSSRGGSIPYFYIIFFLLITLSFFKGFNRRS
ncbi:MAG: cobaltochelatase subunit CobN [Caldimicrobium sp.]